MTHHRLADLPDWTYLLREYYELYRFLPSGGSQPIRTHQRAVRERIGRLVKTGAEVVFTDPADKPVTSHLRRALDQGMTGPTAPVVRALDAIRGQLNWQWGYDRMPKGLDRRYGFAEIAGPTGPVRSTEVILGVVLFAPGCTYPAHAHDGISESYVCLSGAVSENNQGVYAPGSLIYNPPGMLHRITTSDREPSLLAYAWTGTPDRLAGQKMVFTRASRG